MSFSFAIFSADSPIDWPVVYSAIAVRATGSAAATLARSMRSILARSVPGLANGVRQPSTIATRPWAPFSALRSTAWTLTGPPLFSRVQTVSARAVISSRADAMFGGRRGAGGGADGTAAFSDSGLGGIEGLLILARVIYHDYAALRQRGKR